MKMARRKTKEKNDLNPASTAPPTNEPSSNVTKVVPAPSVNTTETAQPSVSTSDGVEPVEPSSNVTNVVPAPSIDNAETAQPSLKDSNDIPTATEEVVTTASPTESEDAAAATASPIPDNDPNEHKVSTPNPVAQQVVPSPPTPAPYSADNVCRVATSCSECFEKADAVYKNTQNASSCKWDESTNSCTKGGPDEIFSCGATSSGGSTKLMVFFVLCAGGVAYYYNNRRRPIPPRGKDKGGKYQSVPNTNDADDWGWEETNADVELGGINENLHDDFSAEDEELQRAMDLSLQDQQNKAVVQANVWDEPIPSPRSNSPRNLPSSNVKPMRIGGAKSLQIPPALKVPTNPVRHDPDDIFASLGFAAQPTKSPTQKGSKLKKNVPNAGSRWNGAVSAAAPVSSSSSALSPSDMLDDADADAWGDDDGLDDL
mmetsp:Transcript_21435/g.32012  ORF Transcript_21435/g.32012 Transcript_21435/m.32012 type:complete len:429 (-) Transcript_21435:76-1362(-)